MKTPTKATYFAHDTTEELEQLHIKDEFVASEIVLSASADGTLWPSTSLGEYTRGAETSTDSAPRRRKR